MHGVWKVELDEALIAQQIISPSKDAAVSFKESRISVDRHDLGRLIQQDITWQ
jgi:hypothetical protein